MFGLSAYCLPALSWLPWIPMTVSFLNWDLDNRPKPMGQVLCDSAVQYSPDYCDTPWIGPWHPYCMHPCLLPVSLPISPSNCFWQCFMLSRRNYILSCNGHYNHMPDLGRWWCGEDSWLSVRVVNTRHEGTRSIMSLGWLSTRTLLGMSTRCKGTWLSLQVWILARPFGKQMIRWDQEWVVIEEDQDGDPWSLN